MAGLRGGSDADPSRRRLLAGYCREGCAQWQEWRHEVSTSGDVRTALGSLAAFALLFAAGSVLVAIFG